MSKVFLLVICSVYAAVRLWRLTDSCLWFDEIFSIHAAEQPWANIFNFVALDLIHPPLFYLLLKVWIAIGGESVLWLRLLPVLTSLVTIFPFLALCRELKLKLPPQLIALFLLAVNGSLIKYAQEVRMYSLLMCLSLFSMLLFLRFLTRPNSILPLIIVNILLVYTHYFGWLVIGSELAVVLILRRDLTSKMSVVTASTMAAFLPWAIAVFSARNHGAGLEQNIGWMERPGVREITTFILDVIEPFYSQSGSMEPASLYAFSVPAAIILAILVGLGLAKWVSKADKKYPLIPAAIFFGFPILAAFAVSWIAPYSIWGVRHLLMVIPPLAILLAASFTSLKPGLLRYGLSGAVLLLSIPGFITISTRAYDNSWCYWGEAVAKANKDTRIYAAEDLIAYHIWFAARNTDKRVARVSGLDGVSEDRAYFLPRGFYEIRTVDISEVSERRVLFAFRGRLVDESGLPLKQFTERGYRIIEVSQLGRSTDVANIVVLER